MSIKGSASGLAQAVKDLSLNWQQTKTSWHDVKSDEFEKKYIEVLPALVAQATSVIDEIDLLLRKIRRDCE